MPLYEYECEKCGLRFEVIQKFSDAPVESCRSCEGKVRRLLSAPAIQFKGTGWYITDYARKGRGGETSSSSPAGAPSSSAPTANGSSADKTAGRSDSSSAPSTPASSTSGTDKK